MGTRHQALKTRQRQERDDYPEDLSLRVHRALSWLDRAEQESDPDSRFIFLWIAFNAAYATEIDDREGLSEQRTFNAFLEKLQSLDSNHRLNTLVWNAYPNAIRVLLDNPYVVRAFWEYQKGSMSQPEWESFRAASESLAAQDTPKLLTIVLARICTLGNQLIHGDVTWVSSVNRDPICDCMSIMDELVLIGSGIQMDSPATLCGDAGYPVIVAVE